MNRKIIDYTLVQNDKSLQFEIFVSKALSEGWQPYGHTQIFSLSNDKILYVQPMVKYEEFIGDHTSETISYWKDLIINHVTQNPDQYILQEIDGFLPNTLCLQYMGKWYKAIKK